MKFELSGAAPRYRGMVRAWSRVLAIVGAGTALATLVLGIEYGLNPPLTLLRLAGLISLAVLAGVFLAVSYSLGGQAIAIEIDSTGFQLIFLRRPPKSAVWSESNLRLNLGYTLGAPDSISRGKPFYEVYLSSGFQSELTREAFNALVEEAKNHGFTSSEKPAVRAGWVSVDLFRPPTWLTN
jgi:hypothetical protein